MNPGPETDALVAEKVMEWKRIQFTTITGFQRVGKVDGWEADPPYKDFYGVEQVQVWPAPPFSTDIRAAMEVVGKMRTTHGFGTFTLEQNKSGDWSVGGWGFFPTIYEDTAPMAICVAALKACDE